MSAGQIILGLVDATSDVAKIITQYDCGFFVPQDDVDGVVDILLRLYDKSEEIEGFTTRHVSQHPRRCTNHIRVSRLPSNGKTIPSLFL
jgi:hypothetical protein